MIVANTVISVPVLMIARFNQNFTHRPIDRSLMTHVNIIIEYSCACSQICGISILYLRLRFVFSVSLQLHS